MKKIFTLFFAVLVSVGTMFAEVLENVKIGDLYYNLDDELATAEVTYKSNNDYEYNVDWTITTAIIPAYVEYNSVMYSVISIGEYAFYGCSGLTSVEIPNSITSIGGAAFSDCESLTSINIPNSVTSVGNYAFQRCTSLPILDNIRYADTYAVEVADNTLSTYVIKSGTRWIGHRVFYYCESLTSINIPNSVTSIGDEAFYDCTSLTSVNIPNSVTSIGREAFSYCESLTSIEIPNTIPNIEMHAFSGCSGLTSVEIPNSVISIGSGAFSGCSGLSSLTIGSGVENIESYAFSSCSGLTSVEIPNSVVSIGFGAFLGCYRLTSVTIGSNVESIESYAFSNCSSLTSVTIPNSVSSIGYSVFSDCSSLTDIYTCGDVDRVKEMLNDDSRVKYVPLPYTISIDATNGTVNSLRTDCETLELSASPNYGYHFTQWSDGISDNPRIVILTQDTTFTAEFVQNTYTITTKSSNPEWGTTAGDKSVLYLDQVEISATANYGYHFVSWNDGNQQNPRAISVTEDKVYIATFAKNIYSITKNADHGYISGSSQALYLDSVTLTVTPHNNYHFTQWSDRNTDNPRTIVLTQDTTFTAEFALDTYTVNLQVSDDDMGSASGAGTYEYGSICEVSATPNYGYHFDEWYCPISAAYVGAITVSQAYNIAAGLGNGETTYSQYTIVGYVTRSYGTYTNSYYLSDSPYEAGNFIVFKCASSANIGDKVLVTGYLTNYKGNTPETTSGSSLSVLQEHHKDNPWSFVVRDNMTITASFAKNVYDLTVRAAVQEQGTATGGGAFAYLNECVFSAIPNHGYHFTQWSDGNTENPRTTILTQDTTFTAEFAPNKYSISVTCDSTQGAVNGEQGEFDYLTELTYVATPKEGYHFDHWEYKEWSFIKEKAIIAMFSIPASCQNPYAWIWKIGGSGHWEKLPMVNGLLVYQTDASDEGIIIVPNGPSWNYGQTVDIFLTESACYTIEKFSSSSYGTGGSEVEKGYDCLDSNRTTINANTIGDYSITDNILKVQLKENTSVEAFFALNVYSITAIFDPNGEVIGTGSFTHLTECTIEAVPHYGYHFVQWSDGITENPRTIILTQDTTFSAEFAIDKSGSCGKDNVLTWSYEDQSKTLTITGNGELTENYTFGVEAPTQMHTLIIGDEVTAIGDSTFYNTKTLNHLFIGSNVESIGNYTFAECRNFDDITCYANIVPTINATTFANVGNKKYIYLYVPSDRERAYNRDEFWGEFDIQIKEAETTTTDGEVTVVPTDNTAEISWPAVDGAETYEIEITKDGEVFCVLTFNAQGQLVGIAFAPGRNGTNYTQQEQTAGFKFTVTGLTSGTHYGYTVAAKDANDQTVDAKSGSFTTTGGVITDIDQIIDDQLPITHKVFRNGQIFILRGDKTYTLQGQEVR